MDNKSDYQVIKTELLGTTFNYRDGTTDSAVFDEVINGEGYEKFNYIINKPPVIIDIGAHIGVSSVIFKKMFPNSRIFAYEPCNDTFSLLKRNVEENGLDIKIFNNAVSGKEGSRELFLGNQSHFVGYSIVTDSINPSQIPEGGSQKTEAITLQDILKDNDLEEINILKMDCEGAEYEIIYKTPKKILSNIDNIIMEFHEFSTNKDRFVKLQEYLQANGFIMQYKNIAETNTNYSRGIAFFTNKKLSIFDVKIEPHINDYFDKIYLINLDRRKDRMEAVTKELEAAKIKNYKRVSAVDFPVEDIKKFPKKLYRNFHLHAIKEEDKEEFEKKYIAASIGVRKSHLSCIKDAKKNGFDKILILEDDVVISLAANNRFKDYVSNTPDDWDVLYLGGDYRDEGVIFQLSSYALNKSIYDYVLENMEKSGLEDDFFFVEDIQKNFKVVKMDPPVMVQSKNSSDIATQRVTNCKH